MRSGMKSANACLYFMHLSARNTRSKRLGHSDNPALLHRYIRRGLSAEGEVYKGAFQTAIWFNMQDLRHYCTALLIVRHRTVELAICFRFVFFILPRIMRTAYQRKAQETISHFLRYQNKERKTWPITVVITAIR